MTWKTQGVKEQRYKLISMKCERKLSKLKVFSLCLLLYQSYHAFTTGSHILISYFVKTEGLIYFLF